MIHKNNLSRPYDGKSYRRALRRYLVQYAGRIGIKRGFPITETLHYARFLGVSIPRSLRGAL